MPSVKVDVVFCNGNQLRSSLNYLFINKKITYTVIALIETSKNILFAKQ